jgi:hypothetical protein
VVKGSAERGVHAVKGSEERGAIACVEFFAMWSQCAVLNFFVV